MKSFRPLIDYQLLPCVRSNAILALSIRPCELDLSVCAPPRIVATDVHTLFCKCKGHEITSTVTLTGSTELVSGCEVDMFASLKNRNEEMFCSIENSAWNYSFKRLGLGWANPPFGCIRKLLTKVALEEADMIVLTPDWPDKNWSGLLESLTVRRVSLPRDMPLYIPETAIKPVSPPTWTSSVRFISGRLRRIPRHTLSTRVIRSVRVPCQGWGKDILKRRMKRPRKIGWHAVMQRQRTCSDVQRHTSGKRRLCQQQ